MFPIRTVGEPGLHGAGNTGIHGIGVRTPKAAEVAAATVGLRSEEHIPNGVILTMGLLSIIVATGRIFTVLFSGRILRIAGATPKAH